MLEWSLSALFKNEEEFEAFTCENIGQAEEFRQKCEKEITHLSKEEFLVDLRQYENLNENATKITTYAYLYSAKNTLNGDFYARYEEKCRKIEENLLFLELEFCELEELKSSEFVEFCEDYALYLDNLLKSKKFNLSRKEERILLYLPNTGANASSRLFDESTSALRINFEGQKLSEEGILSRLYHSDRKVRKKATKNFTKALDKNASLLSFTLNMIKIELENICHLGGYENAEMPRHLNNQILQKSVDALISSAKESYHLVEDFYSLKKQVLGFKELEDYDRHAPLGKEASFSFEKSKDIVLKTLKSFSSEFEDIAKEAFEKGWIDVYPKEDKQGGAFSYSAIKEAHPYILPNYTNKRRDLFTLIHELGHTVHQKFSYRVSFLNQNTPLTAAETTPVFAEMLVFDYVKNKFKNEELIALYAAKIGDIFTTFCKQISFTCFERRVHKGESELKEEQIDTTWMEESVRIFGKSVKLTKDYAFWWGYIPHFIHSPSCCYAYSYAQLLVLALYGPYKSGKCGNFKEFYIKMLSRGGSVSPKELISVFGPDVEDENFWQFGTCEIEKLLKEFKIKALEC